MARELGAKDPRQPSIQVGIDGAFPDLGRRRRQRQPHRNHRDLALDAPRRDLERSIRPLLPAAHDRGAARDNDLSRRGSVGSKHARRVPPLVRPLQTFDLPPRRAR